METNCNFPKGIIPGFCQKIEFFYGLFWEKSTRTRSDFEKHLTIKNCDKTFLNKFVFWYSKKQKKFMLDKKKIGVLIFLRG